MRRGSRSCEGLELSTEAGIGALIGNEFIRGAYATLTLWFRGRSMQRIKDLSRTPRGWRLKTVPKQ